MLKQLELEIDSSARRHASLDLASAPIENGRARDMLRNKAMGRFDVREQ
jgi:hypothetical protein